MKHTRMKITAATFAAILLGSMGYSSCKKSSSSPSPNAVFTGKWVGTDCQGNAGAYTITPSPTNSSQMIISFPVTQGVIDYCSPTIPVQSFTATVTSTKTNSFTTNTIIICDSCAVNGTNWVVNANGSLANGQLIMNYLSIAFAFDSVSCTFTGTK